MKALMHKRLRYAMPKVPLLQHRGAEKEEELLEMNNPQEPVPGVSNVNVMAKRIGQMEKKKREAYKRPLEKPLGGDLENSESDDFDDSDDTDSGLI